MRETKPFWDLAMMVRVSGAVMVLAFWLLIAVQGYSIVAAHLDAGPDSENGPAKALALLLSGLFVLAIVAIYWITTGLMGVAFRQRMKKRTSGPEDKLRPGKVLPWSVD